MIDEALRARHRRRRRRRSPSELGIPVIEMVAIEGRGLAASCATRCATRGAGRAPAHARRDDRAAWAHELTARVRTRRARCRSAASRNALARADARAAHRPADPRASCSTSLYLFVGVFGAQTLVGAARGRPLRPRHQPGGDLARRSRSSRSRCVRDFLVGEYGLITMGADLRDRDRAAGRHDLLPDVRLPRGQRLHPAPGHLQRSHLPRHGPERQGGAADGARPRLRHDGDDDDADPGDAEGAADRDPAAGARHSVLGAAGHDHGHPRRHLVRRARSRCSASCSAQMFLVGWLAARVLHGRALRVHHGAAADPLAAARQPAHQDAAARLVVPRRGGAAVPGRHGAAVRARSRRRARRARARRRGRSSPACSACRRRPRRSS